MSQADSSISPLSRSLDEPQPSAMVYWIQILVLGGLLVAVFWGPIVHNLIEKWSTDPDWSQGWIIPVFSLYCIYDRREELKRAPRSSNALGLLILAAALAAYIYYSLFDYRLYLRTAAIVPAIFGMTLFVSGWQRARILAFPIFFLLLAVPLPEGLYIKLTFPLRQLATFMAAVILPIIPGVETELGSGTILDYSYNGATGSLNVEEACSGMRSMMGIVTLGVVMAYLGRRPMWQRIILVISCIPISVFCNWFRVVATGVLYISGHRDWARGTPHALLGMAVFAVALGLFSLLGWILNRIFVDEATESGNNRGPAAPRAAEDPG